jgi:antitoxin (DNA-binding transcriptional repressor) of toxin-antitoxin stability system
MNDTVFKDQAIYRIRRFYKKGHRPKKYRNSFEVIDESTQQVMASCDLIGQAVFATTSFADQDQQVWQMKPNRRIMPSRWIVTDPGGNAAVQFDQKILGKIVNPLYKVVLAILDAEGREIFRLVDPRTNIPDRIMAVNVGEWTIVDGDRPVAKLTSLPREQEAPKGMFKKLKKIFVAYDRAIVSTGGRHFLPAPAALGMLLIFDELTDISGV